MPAKSILVTGGAGYIGSHVVKMLTHAGYHPVAFDNLSMGDSRTVIDAPFIKGDLANTADLDNVFNDFDIAAVMHFAAFTDVGESVKDPAKYYDNNVINTWNLLQAMRRHHVQSIVFSSSAAIFGYPLQDRIDENHPCQPINPYGETKLMVEKMLRHFDAAYGIKGSALRYFNAAGGDPEGRIKYCKRRSSNLIPLILASLKNPQGEMLKINGADYPTLDGTCIRDYIHIDDIGRAHLLALEQLFAHGISTHYNLGNGRGFSVQEVIHAVEKVTKQKVRTITGPRRPGDPPILIADSKKARSELGWTPQYPDLETMIFHAWQALNH